MSLEEQREAPRRGAIVLAAGASRRMGRPKATLPFDKRGDRVVTFLERAADLALSGCPEGPVIIVQAADRRFELPPRVGLIAAVNPAPERGMFSSIQVGLTALADAAGGSVPAMLFLVDHPLVRPETVGALWAAHAADPGMCVVPEHEGAAGHPIVLTARIVARVLDEPPDSRLDGILEREPTRRVEVDDPGVTANINTPERLRKLVETTS